MEEQARDALARGRLTPRFETELQAYRAVRRAFPVVLLCLGCSMLLFSQFLRIALSVAKILIFNQPLYSAVSLWVAVVCIGFAVFLLIWGLFALRRAAKRRIRKLKEAFGAIPTLTCSFYADTIELRSDGAETGVRFSYSAIRRCTETRDLFLLVTKEKQSVAVEKNRLELVNKADFCALLDEKCPKAKRRWRKAE